ncbi:fibronectin type III domain-containing protein [Myxococcus sp. AM009]|uniref:fibronectin type III domain-containing protein n=1 Tax=Myxococcus sp. AM009 TaxID=2745137 RepID=UPI0020CD5096|nr:fibronectin type III domain-containing protein [Myxococcus sp. AM009]
MHRIPLKAWCVLLLVGVAACGGESEPTPSGVPGAPRSVTATPGDTLVTTSWSAPENEGNSPIQRYVVRALRNGAVAHSQEGTSTSLTLTGLTNGETYTLVVAAVNAQGEGPASAPSEAVTPRVIPGAPREVTATPGDRSAEVSWSPPEETDMPVTGYTVTVRQGETVVVAQTSTELHATVSGLINGTAYQVTVAASNAVVAGPESAPVAVTPVSVPGAPRVWVHSRTATVLSFAWEAEDTGGSPITGYRVVLRQGDTVVETADTTETLHRFRNLTTGTPYRFVVIAINAQGEGAPAEFEEQRPCAIPGTPALLQAQPQDGQLILTWSVPADTGGCPIASYRVDVSEGGGGPSTRFETITETRLVVTGLPNGQYHVIEVFSRNEAGLGLNPARVQATPYSAPGLPGSFTATPGDGTVLLEWTRAPVDGGPLWRYVVTVEPAVGDTDTFYLSPDDVSRRLDGLVNGTTYTFTIRADNRAGQGPTATTQATPMAP